MRLQTEVLDERGVKIKRDVDLEIERNHYSEPELELTLQRKLGPHSEFKVKRKLYAVFQCQFKFVVELEAGLRFRWTSSTCYWYSYCYLLPLPLLLLTITGTVTTGLREI